MPTSLAEFAERRIRLAGKAILEHSNPWFVPVDRLSSDVEAAGGSLTSFAHYDYLSLAGHPKVNQAAVEAISRFGTGALGSRLVGGERTIHAAFERAISSFLGADAALTLVSGYLTNVSVISHLLGPRDLLVTDELCHHSILAGARAGRSQVTAFRHNDLDDLESILRSRREDARNCLVAVEGLYSMDGDLPDLPRLLRLREKYKNWLLVDEAHSLGVLGATGRGISEHFGEDPRRIDLITGTLSKALVSCGGFVCARPEIIEFLKFTLGGFVYSVGLSPMIVASAHAALEILIAEPERTKAVGRAAEKFLAKARQAGLNTGPAIGRGIVPVMFNDLEKTLNASEALLRANIYAPPIVHVGVPKDLPRIRFFLSAIHENDPAIDTAVTILAKQSRTGSWLYGPVAKAAAE